MHGTIIRRHTMKEVGLQGEESGFSMQVWSLPGPLFWGHFRRGVNVIILTLLILQTHVLTCSSLLCVTTKYICSKYGSWPSLKMLWKHCLVSVFIFCPVWEINREPQGHIPNGSALKEPIREQYRTSDLIQHSMYSCILKFVHLICEIKLITDTSQVTAYVNMANWVYLCTERP